jgi:hypothetical protein
MGLGIFATRPLDAGALVMSERAFAIALHEMHVAVSPEEAKGLTPAQLHEVGQHQIENLLQLLLGKMAPADRKAFLSLANTRADDGSGPLSGILHTNSFAVRIPTKGAQGTDGGVELYAGVFDTLSRVNHRCVLR